jgi:hypothetical protein
MTCVKSVEPASVATSPGSRAWSKRAISSRVPVKYSAKLVEPMRKFSGLEFRGAGVSEAF